MGKSAPTPDNSAVVNAQSSVAAANNNYALENSQLAWAQDQWNAEQPIINQVANSELNAEGEDQAIVADNEHYFRHTIEPTLTAYNTEANNWASPDQLAVNSGAAEAGVANSMASQKQAALSQLGEYGVDPTSGRYAALDYGYNAATGASEAGAGTTALQNTKLQGMQLQQNAYSMGAGLENDTAGISNAGTTAGTGAGNTLDSALTTGSNANTATTAYANAGTNAMNTDVSAVNGYNQAMEQGYQASQQGAAGLGSLFGGLMGVLADGGSVDNPNQALPITAPLPAGGTPGGAIPTQASPTGGAAVDDVPARLTVGEFVAPKDVTSWLGEKYMYNMIDKARQERAQAQARTDVGGKAAPAIPAAPAFVSRPQQAIRTH